MNLKMAENRVRGPTYKLLAVMNISVYQAKDVKVNINSLLFYQNNFFAKIRLCCLNSHELNQILR